MTISPQFDVIGIGALNLDHILTRTRQKGINPDLIEEVFKLFEFGNEQSVSEKEIDKIIHEMGLHNFEHFLGGSAFNTMHAIAAMNSGLRLGYIGIAGEVDVNGLDFKKAFNNYKIDAQFVEGRSERAGVCISFIKNGERSLKTWHGANKMMADFLKNNFSKILDYIARTRIIHVTSFFDTETPKILADLIEEAKRQNSKLEVSFDPGYHWLANISKDVHRLLKLSNILFLNNQEFDILGHSFPNTKPKIIASNIYEFCEDDAMLIVLKSYDKIIVFYWDSSGDLREDNYDNKILQPGNIEDATGAGDLFAGGFLTSRLFPNSNEMRIGINFGLQLVHSKLAFVGTNSFNHFHAFFDELMKKKD